VEQQKEIAVEVRIVGVPQPPRPVAMRRALDLDHIGAEPGQHLRAGRTRLIVSEIDDANAFESLAHIDPPINPRRSFFWCPSRAPALGQALADLTVPRHVLM